jgi:hypothetical protein
MATIGAIDPSGIADQDLKPSELEDAGRVQILAADIVRYLTRSAEVKEAGDVYVSPVDPDIAIPVDAKVQKEVFEDPIAAAWKEIQSIAAGH